MPRLIDITGQTFGKLKVIERDDTRKGNVTYWLCKCSCGNPKILSIPKNALTSGNVRSCGCLKRKPKKEISNIYDLTGEYGIGYTTNTNKEFYFDLEDYDKIKNYCWYENNNGYIVTQRRRKTIKMHRLIMNVVDSKTQIDHIYHRKNDNRKDFLRIVTNQQNCFNKKCNGIYYDNSKNKWVGKLMYNGVSYSKRFKTKEEAIKYRKELEDKYFGDFVYKE